MRGIEQIPWVYDLIFWAMELFGLGRWRRWLVAGAKGRTLDIGCGTGRNLPLYEQDMDVVGLDPDPHALRRASLRAPSIELVLGSAETLPFPDASFDTVVSGLVFCSVANPVKGLREVRRVLRPGGQLRMIEHVRATARWRQWWQDLIQPAWVCIIGGCHTNRDTETNLRLAGFEIDEHVAVDNFRKIVATPSLTPQPTPVALERARDSAEGTCP